TDAAPAPRRRRRGPLRVALASAALLAAVLVLLAARVAAGQDPVLKAADANRPRPRHLVVRRIVRKVIVETTVPARRHLHQEATVASSPVAVSSASVEP